SRPAVRAGAVSISRARRASRSPRERPLASEEFVVSLIAPSGCKRRTRLRLDGPEALPLFRMPPEPPLHHKHLGDPVRTRPRCGGWGYGQEPVDRAADSLPVLAVPGRLQLRPHQPPLEHVDPVRAL